jgi:LPS-assembly lipoprotein
MGQSRNPNTTALSRRESCRRRYLSSLAFAIGLVALTGCGWQLRGREPLPFSSLYVHAATTSQVGNEIKRTLRASNTRIADKPESAQATLIIMSEIREKNILSLGGQGRVREYQLRFRVGYKLTDGKAVTFIPPTEIVLTREISFNDSEVLAKEAEEALLYRDMQTDAVHQLMRRLRAAKISS